MSNAEGPNSGGNIESPTSDKKSESSTTKSKKYASRLIKREIEEPKSTDKSPRFNFLDLSKKSETKDEPPKPSKLKELEDSNPVSEELAPEDRLSSEESTLIAAVTREESKRQRDLETPADEIEQQVKEALDDYDYKIIEEGKDAETAADEVLIEHNIDPPEHFEDDTAKELDADTEEPEDDPGLTDETFGEEEINISHEIDTISDDEDDEASTASTSSTPPARIPSSGGVGSSSTGGSSASSYYSRPTATYGTTHLSPTPGTRIEYKNRPRDHDLFTGLLVGYLIGRRRGRIKTERKLLPVQKRLEKQVNTLENKLESNEYKIRALVSEKARTKNMLNTKDTVVQHIELEENVKTEALPAAEVVIAAKVVSTETKRNFKREHTTEIKHSEEMLGHMIMDKEASEATVTPISKLEKMPSPSNLAKSYESKEIKEKALPVRVETLKHDELVAISEKIIVEGSSLKEVYESHLVSEKGLRRLVAEYLRGGDLKKELKREIVERQIDFERDPMMRDRGGKDAGVSNAGGKASSPSDTLSAMISQVEEKLKLAPADEELAFYKAKSSFEDKEKVEEQKKRKYVDSAIVTAITVLAVVIVILLFNRG